MKKCTKKLWSIVRSHLRGQAASQQAVSPCGASQMYPPQICTVAVDVNKWCRGINTPETAECKYTFWSHGFPRQMVEEHTDSPSPHTRITRALKWGEDLLVTSYKFAQCVRKLELIHILNFASCFIVRHLFCYSHQGNKKAAISYIELFAFASPFVCWLSPCRSVAAAMPTKPLR